MLIWFCKNCRAQEPVESTGDPDEEYVEGDTEKCIDCGSFCKVYSEEGLKEVLEEDAREKAEAAEEAKEHDFSKGVRGKYAGRS